MKKSCLILVMSVLAFSGHAQKRGLVLIPHVVMESGTVVSSLTADRARQVILNINGNTDNELVTVSIEKNGVVIDELLTNRTRDRIIVNTDVSAVDDCTIVVRTESEKVEVAKTNYNESGK